MAPWTSSLQPSSLQVARVLRHAKVDACNQDFLHTVGIYLKSKLQEKKKVTAPLASWDKKCLSNICRYTFETFFERTISDYFCYLCCWNPCLSALIRTAHGSGIANISTGTKTTPLENQVNVCHRKFVSTWCMHHSASAIGPLHFYLYLANYSKWHNLNLLYAVRASAATLHLVAKSLKPRFTKTIEI